MNRKNNTASTKGHQRTGEKKVHKTRGPRAERTAHGLKAVGLFSDRVVRPILGKRGLAEGDLLRHWNAIVGKSLAGLSQPERIRFPKGQREQGDLTVRVGSGAAATVLQHEADRVLERVNQFCGGKTVHRMKILQAPLPQRRQVKEPQMRSLSAEEESALQETLGQVSDPNLRASLESLGRSLLGRRPPLEKF